MTQNFGHKCAFRWSASTCLAGLLLAAGSVAGVVAGVDADAGVLSEVNSEVNAEVLAEVKAEPAAEPEGNGAQAAGKAASDSRMDTLASPGVIHLVYEAYLGSAHAGRADVSISREGDTYKVEGAARSKGLWERLKQWRATVVALGRSVSGSHELISFELFEKDNGKSRHILVADGELRENKNGRQRPPRKVLAGQDLLTALFLGEDCGQEMSVHTGRHGYSMVLQAASSKASGNSSGKASARTAANTSAHSAAEAPATVAPREVVCRYRITDDDGEHTVADFRFVERYGLRLPLSIVSQGFMAGRLELVRDSQVAAIN